MKLRTGGFDETSVVLPQYLNAQGIQHIIAPHPTKDGNFWTNLDDYRVILYPFVAGRDGYEVNLSDHHWRELGAALKRLHTAIIPPSITNCIRRETFSPQWRESVETFIVQAAQGAFTDPIANQVAALLRTKQAKIGDLVGRPDRLAQMLQTQSLEFVVCHSDLHAGNILIDETSDTFYIVDWDETVLAPKERDLMHIGGGWMGGWRTPQEEEALFYQGYGSIQINATALAYYRYERIIQDIAEFCKQLLMSDEGGADRAQSLRYLESSSGLAVSSRLLTGPKNHCSTANFIVNAADLHQSRYVYNGIRGTAVSGFKEKIVMTTRTKVTLTPEQETLLITLYAKAQPDNPLFFDPHAQDVLNRIDYDYSRLRVPYKTVILVCQRAKKLDAVTQAFLAEHPDGMVLQLGCGLDGRFWRVDNGRVHWVDLDMPPVAELRRQIFPGSERYHLLASSVTDLDWMEQVNAAGRPVLAVAEGLLMYLSEDDVRRLVLQLREKFPGCRLAADVFSRLTARSATGHPSLKQTGASLGWGIDDPRELEGWAVGIRLLEEWYFSDDPDLTRLNFGYRLAYKLAGAFQMVKRAHRIVYYQF